MSDRAARRCVGTLTAAALGIALLGACSNGSTDGPETKAEPTATTAVAPLDPQTGSTLEEARDAAEAAGYAASAHNATESDTKPSANWRVCFQAVSDDTVDFGVVEEGALCPKKDGGPLTWPEVPDVTGRTYAKAVNALTKAGLDEDNIVADSVYKDVSVSLADAQGSPGDYTTCFQSPAAGVDLKPITQTVLALVKGDSCPSKKGTYKDKTNDPDYTPPPTPKPTPVRTAKPSPTSPAEWNGQCELTSPAGNCYRAGQFCANKHLGLSTHDANGRIIYCKQRSDGQRWNYS